MFSPFRYFSSHREKLIKLCPCSELVTVWKAKFLKIPAVIFALRGRLSERGKQEKNTKAVLLVLNVEMITLEPKWVIMAFKWCIKERILKGERIIILGERLAMTLKPRNWHYVWQNAAIKKYDLKCWRKNKALERTMIELRLFISCGLRQCTYMDGYQRHFNMHSLIWG